jgi:hypothetical protein
MKIRPLSDRTIVKELDDLPATKDPTPTNNEAATFGQYPGKPQKPRNPSAPLTFYFDLHEFSINDIAELLSLFSELYRSSGGDGLVIRSSKKLRFSSVLEPA